jgi:hypothetical protein
VTLDERLTVLAAVRVHLDSLRASVPDPTNHGYALARAIAEAAGALDRLRALFLDAEGR